MGGLSGCWLTEWLPYGAANTHWTVAVARGKAWLVTARNQGEQKHKCNQQTWVITSLHSTPPPITCFFNVAHFSHVRTPYWVAKPNMRFTSPGYEYDWTEFQMKAHVQWKLWRVSRLPKTSTCWKEQGLQLRWNRKFFMLFSAPSQ